MRARGHEVNVLCASPPLRAGGYLHNAVTVKRLSPLTMLYGTPILPNLPKELRKLDVDILHANFPTPYNAIVVAAISTLGKIPAVLTWHNDLPPVTSRARFLIEAHDRLVLPNYIAVYRRVISTSGAYVKRSRILSTRGDLVTVIPNGVDCERFHPGIDASKLRGRLGLNGRFIILFVGAMTKWHRYKGVDVLLKGLTDALKAHPDLLLLVVGDGHLWQFYCSLSRQLNLAGHTLFVGDVPADQLPQYHAAADVLVLPSKDMSEGFGLTLLEANATGNP